jgi:hypothetical protein
MYPVRLGICLGGERSRRRSHWSEPGFFMDPTSVVEVLLLFLAWHRTMDRWYTLGAFACQVLSDIVAFWTLIPTMISRDEFLFYSERELDVELDVIGQP